MAGETTCWSEEIPIIVLGCPKSIKEDLKCPAADMVYGQPLHMPGVFLFTSNSDSTEPADVLSELKSTFQDLQLGPPKPFISKELKIISHVLYMSKISRCPSNNHMKDLMELFTSTTKQFTLTNFSKGGNIVAAPIIFILVLSCCDFHFPLF